ncbi:MAG: HAD hydrolase-like protein [Alphaproteobacteria bacterium]|nr:HAD hydrolase-like protein [Alphaproteobacteria bacterium]
MKKTTIISDLDGTLYSKNIGLTNQIDNLASAFLSNATGMDSRQLSQFELAHPNILDALNYFGIDKQTYYNNVHNKLDYSALHPDLALNNLLTSKNINLFVVSFSPKEHIIRVLSSLNLISNVTDIFAVSETNCTNKGDCYKDIIEKYNLYNPDICVVGDNYILDIEPAKKLGIDVALISTSYHDEVLTFPNFVNFLQSNWFKVDKLEK